MKSFISGILASSVIALAAGTIVPPTGFSPDGQFVLGISDDQANSTSLANATSIYGNLYHFRNITANAGSNGTTLAAQIASFAAASSANQRPSIVMSLFNDTTSSVDTLLAQMNNATFMYNLFSEIKQLGDTLKVPNLSGVSTTVFIEPNVWARLLQARFHFETAQIPRDPTHTYGDILKSAALVKASSIGLTDPSFAFLNGYDNTVGDLSRALVHAVHQFFPAPTLVGIPVNTWAAYAYGCSQAGALTQINNLVHLNPFSTMAQKGIQTWDSSSIKIGAYANIRFYRQMFDSAQSNPSAGNLAKPDLYGMQRNPFDAGMVWNLGSPGFASFLVNMNTGSNGGRGLVGLGAPGATATAFPGYGSTVFYWNQHAWDNWIYFSTLFSQGMSTPLVALRMAIGHIGMPNQTYAWEDTFYDWLFNNPSTVGGFCADASDTIGVSRTANCGWQAGNFAKFKSAGFIGIWLSRDGWPDIGTHYGSITTDWYFGGTLSTSQYFSQLYSIQGVQGQALASAQCLNGDGGMFISTLHSNDRSFPSIVNNFSETDFAKYAGNCSAPSLPVVSGIDVKGYDTLISTAKSPIFNVGSTDDTAGISSTFSNPMLTVAMDSLGRLPTQVMSSVNSSNPALAQNQLAYYASNPNQPRLHLSISYANAFDSVGHVDSTQIPPFSYHWSIFDHQGQFIAMEKNTIPSSVVAKYLTHDTSGAGNNAVLNLAIYYNMRDSHGRKIGAGVYMWKGAVDEEHIVVDLKTVNSQGQEQYQERSSQNQPIFQKFGVIRQR